ncbi:MAG TPA: hypothetical protein VK537_08020 [Galbitalea sp.]|nr:hypothetical protein [Galbitalea sp.]
MAQEDAGTHTLEYGHAPIPAVEAEFPDFGEPEASHVAGDKSEAPAAFEAPDFGGAEDP